MHRTLVHADGGWLFAMHCAVGAYQRGMVFSMGDVDSWQEVLCRIILVGIVLKLWLSVIFSMIYLSIKCFYEKMSEKLVFCC